MGNYFSFIPKLEYIDNFSHLKKKSINSYLSSLSLNKDICTYHVFVNGSLNTYDPFLLSYHYFYNNQEETILYDFKNYLIDLEVFCINVYIDLNSHLFQLSGSNDNINFDILLELKNLFYQNNQKLKFNILNNNNQKYRYFKVYFKYNNINYNQIYLTQTDFYGKLYLMD